MCVEKRFEKERLQYNGGTVLTHVLRLVIHSSVSRFQSVGQFVFFFQARVVAKSIFSNIPPPLILTQAPRTLLVLHILVPRLLVLHKLLELHKLLLELHML